MGLAGAMRSAERDGGDPLYPLYSPSGGTADLGRTQSEQSGRRSREGDKRRESSDA